MDKITSFIIIILCIYISYEYCSVNVIEGQASDPGISTGDYTGPGSGRGLAPGANTQSSDTSDAEDCNKPGTPCYIYKDKDCMRETITESARDNWIYGDKGDNISEKQACMKCIQGSKQMTTMPHTLANIGYYANTSKKSYYALRYCDAMAADCDSRSWYANGHSDWNNQDCKDVSITDDTLPMSTRLICNMIGNSILQFFMSFLSGVTCTLKIKALELVHFVKEIPDKIGKELKDLGKNLVDNINPF
jgi:hypothetical protein